MASFYKILFSLFFATALLVSCDDSDAVFDDGAYGEDAKEDFSALPDIKPFAKGDTVTRTLLIYIMAENSISKDLTDDFDEIKRAAYHLPDDVRLFVYFDNSDAIRLPSLFQYHPYNGHVVENVVYKFDNDVCSSDTSVLGRVMKAVFDDYPTRNFDLIMGSHADGWIRHEDESRPNRTIGIDNGKNSYSNSITTTIEIEELAALLECLPVKVDRLLFDACLMQGVEVAYALRNSANWIIASPAEIPAYGAPYDKIVPEFFNSGSSVEDIMYEYKKSYDNEYYGVVLSAVRTSCMQELADSTRACVEKYFKKDSSIINAGSLAYVPNCVPAYYDVNSMMKRILDGADYECWKSAFDKAVPYIMVSNYKMIWSNIAYNKWGDWFKAVVTVDDDAGAVSAYFPQNKSMNVDCNRQFCTTEWYHAAGWSSAGW